MVKRAAESGEKPKRGIQAERARSHAERRIRSGKSARTERSRGRGDGEPKSDGRKGHARGSGPKVKGEDKGDGWTKRRTSRANREKRKAKRTNSRGGRKELDVKKSRKNSRKRQQSRKD